MTALHLSTGPRIARAWLDTLRVVDGQPEITAREITRCRDVDRESALLTVRALERQGLRWTRLPMAGLRPVRCTCIISSSGQRALEAS